MLEAAERDKYEEVWSLPEYARHSPGEAAAGYFVEICRPAPGSTVADFGCGKGAGGKALDALGLVPTYIDIANVGAPQPFVMQPLWRPFSGRWQYGYCCDVMEHIPEAFTMLCARNMLDACGTLFLAISFTPDHFGAYVGKPLHLTVKPFAWWRDALSEVGTLIEARDRIGEGVFVLA